MNRNIIKCNIFVEFFIVLYILIKVWDNKQSYFRFSDTEQYPFSISSYSKYDWSENNFGGQSNSTFVLKIWPEISCFFFEEQHSSFQFLTHQACQLSRSQRKTHAIAPPKLDHLSEKCWKAWDFCPIFTSLIYVIIEPKIAPFTISHNCLTLR